MIYYLFDNIFFIQWPQKMSRYRIRIRPDPQLIGLPDLKEIYMNPQHWLQEFGPLNVGIFISLKN